MKIVGFSGIGLSVILLCSCKNKEPRPAEKQATPVVTNQGLNIRIPDAKVAAFFEAQTVEDANLQADMVAPASVAAVVEPSMEHGVNVVLFNDPDMTANYSQLVQHRNNIIQKQNIVAQKNAIIKQKLIELERFEDLAHHGAGTGKDVNDAKTDMLIAETDMKLAQTDLNAEKSGLIENETLIKTGGFDPATLSRASAGMLFIICDIPETQMSYIRDGAGCQVRFTSFPNQVFTGRIAKVADVVDNVTRMVKVRIVVQAATGAIKAGMFASVSFGVHSGRTISVPSESLVTVNGNNYVFVKKSASDFERRQISTGPQINNRILVYSGLQPQDQIVTQGVMQLKGLSFGY